MHGLLRLGREVRTQLREVERLVRRWAILLLLRSSAESTWACAGSCGRCIAVLVSSANVAVARCQTMVSAPQCSVSLGQQGRLLCAGGMPRSGQLSKRDRVLTLWAP